MSEVAAPRLRLAAYHEVGHVLPARYYGMPLVGVLIDPADGSGMCWGPRGKPAKLGRGGACHEDCATARTIMPEPWEEARADAAPMLLQAHTRVVQLVAGRECERLFFPEESPLDAGQDEFDAEEFARLVCSHPNAVADFIGYARAEARALLGEHRSIVEALVAALLKKLTLTCEEVDAVIAQALTLEDLAAEKSRRSDWAHCLANAATFAIYKEAVGSSP
jgi:hypothetical protein